MKKEITVTVSADEENFDAITRYMRKIGYERQDWIDGRDLPHTEFYSPKKNRVAKIATYTATLNADMSGTVTFSLL